MLFREVLNQYLEQLNVSARQLCDICGLSPASLSRYRNGERVPEINSDILNSICHGISELSQNSDTCTVISETEVMQKFEACADIIATDTQQFRANLNTLLNSVEINIRNMCRHIGYDESAFFRIRSGSRNPSNPMKLADHIASYIGENCTNEIKHALSELMGVTEEQLKSPENIQECLNEWLIFSSVVKNENITSFLEKLNAFDLNEYIRLIHFDEMKVPSMPFQLPSSKYYYGMKEMMKAEIDWLKSTVLSRSMKDVIMYSDMPMEEMSKDPDFPKQWMYGMAMMLKKGLHLSMIHNIDRPMHEMMLGLESWIPMYMTGQVTPYYLDDAQNRIFHHFIKVSDQCALSGEGIQGHFKDGRYYLTNNREEVAYYTKRAKQLLAHAHPLMEVINGHTAIITNPEESKYYRNIMSSLPLYTMEKTQLEAMLETCSVDESVKEAVRDEYERLCSQIETVLKHGAIMDEIPVLSEKDFTDFPPHLITNVDADIPYTYEQYQIHMESCRRFAERHEHYTLVENRNCTFRNLHIHIVKGEKVIVSKLRAPSITFVIHHPKLVDAIENFVPPVIEE